MEEKKSKLNPYCNNSAHHSFRMEVLGGGEALIFKNKFNVNKFHSSLRVETAKPSQQHTNILRAEVSPYSRLRFFI